MTIEEEYRRIQKTNLKKKKKVLIVFDNMIADMETNKKLKPIVSELFKRSRKLHISLVFISQSYFQGPKNIRINLENYLTKENSNKRIQLFI